MNTTSIGNKAELTVVEWLEANGYRVIDKNWKTRWCEIDIVAVHEGIVSFIEVRHRRSDTWGDGIDSITNKKRKQVEFAAHFWLHQKKWQGDARIMIVATAGEPPHVRDVVEL